MAYRYVYASRADRQLNRLPQRQRERVIARVHHLTEQPRGTRAKQLKGRPVLWTSRVGDLRIVYSIDDRAELILIEAVGNRDNIYDLMRRRG